MSVLIGNLQHRLRSATAAKVALARSHPAYLGEYALGLRPTGFHVEWHDHCIEHDFAIIRAPIEFGKTNQLSVIHTLWELGKNPDLREVIVGSAAKMARKSLSLIRSNIEANPRVRDVFPDLVPEDRKGWPKAWHSEALVVRRSRKTAFAEKDFSVQAIGIGSRILGARIDRLCMDDVLDLENTQTELMRENVIHTIDAVYIGRLTDGGRFRMIGNAWHEGDASYQLPERHPGVYIERTYEAGSPECDWPPRWPPARLAEMRRRLGDVEYDRQFRCRPYSEATGFMPMEHIRRCQALCDDPPRWWHGEYPDGTFRWTTCGIDLGMSHHDDSPLTVFFVVGIDAEQLKHVVHIRSGLWTGPDILRNLVDVWRTYRVKETLVETNAAQLLIAEMMADERILRAVGVERREALRIAIRGQYTTRNRNELAWGIRGLAPEFQAEIWRIPTAQPEIEDWIGELHKYTPWEKPKDRTIAGWLAWKMLHGKGRPLALKAASR